MIDEIEGSYLGELMDGKHEQYQELAWNSTVPLLTGGSGMRLTDSMGVPWTAAYIDSIGHPLADLRSDIAAEARAKVVYDRLIKLCPDAGARDALTFLMTREVAHQKMFESALAAISNNFPSSNVPPDPRFTHKYFDESQDDDGTSAGINMVNAQGLWEFELSKPQTGQTVNPELPEPKPSVASTEGSGRPEPTINTTSRTTVEEIAGSGRARQSASNHGKSKR